jgi:hypothetical protein
VSTWFTDNVVVAAPLVEPHESEVLLGMAEVSAAYLQVIPWEEGFIGRGAITFGPHYMDERFVFGKALVEAVEIEKHTVWPRVTLSPTAIDMEHVHSGFYGNTLSSEQSRCLLRDEKGVVFVDCLGIVIDEEDDLEVRDYHLGRLRESTMRSLARLPRDSREWEKWRWIGDYQNHALKSRLGDPEPFLVHEENDPFRFASFNDPRFDTPPGSAWYIMDRAFSGRITYLDDPPVFDAPGVYAIYDDDRNRLFVQCARTGCSRAKADLGRTPATAKNSALCRRLADQLGIAPARAIEDGSYVLTEDDLKRLHAKFAELRMGACETTSLATARAFEQKLLAEFVPPLNR